MLLGIALHAALPFVPYWADGDPGGGLLFGLFEFIHGFRMPLFFVLSGYFTTMLWRSRGLREMIDHRLRRVGLPFLASVAVVLPLLLLGVIAGYVLSGEDPRLADVGGVYEDVDAAGVVDGDSSGSEASDDEDAEFGVGHLWFLWFLIWMVAGFAAVVGAVARFARRRERDRVVPHRLVTLCLILLPPLAVVPATMMSAEIFGPDTSEAIVPDVAVFAYYACFFAFGALVHDRHSGTGEPLIDAVGRWWPAQLVIGSAVLFPVGLALLGERPSVSAALQVAFAWMISFGLLGMFRRFLSDDRFHVRWLSDASYWMYLMHLPLVFVFQGIVAALGVPPLLGFVSICAAVTPLLLISYRSWVRYTFVGTMLNGHRSRDEDTVRRSNAATSTPST